MRLLRSKRSTWKSVVRPADVVGVGLYGLRGRTGRSILTAIGISIGIASIVAVFGISASSKADLLAQIDDLGTDLLVVQAGNSVFGDESQLPVDSTSMIRRITPGQHRLGHLGVEHRCAAERVRRRQQRHRRPGHRARAVRHDRRLAGPGRFLDASTSTLPTVVLGAVAAERLGITDLHGSPTVEIGGRPFAVIGILDVRTAASRPRSLGVRRQRRRRAPLWVPSCIRPDLPAHRPAARRRGARRAGPHREPDRAQRGQRVAALRCTRGARPVDEGSPTSAHRSGSGGRWESVVWRCQRHGHLGARTPDRDRSAPRAGATRHHIGLQFLVESATLTTLGGITGASLARRSPTCTPDSRTGPSRSRRRSWVQPLRPPWPSERWPGCNRLLEPPR